MKKINLLILLAILLCSCSPQKRLSRLISKHPELVKSDTVKISDTTIFSSIRVDTAFKNQVSIDTSYIYKDRLVIKYFNRGDSIFIDGEVRADTIIKEIPIAIHTVSPIREVPVTKWYHTAAMWGFWILFLIFLILWLIKRR